MPRPHGSVLVFRGLHFPEPTAPDWVATRSPKIAGVDDDNVAHAERVLGARIIAIDGVTALLR